MLTELLGGLAADDDRPAILSARRSGRPVVRATRGDLCRLTDGYAAALHARGLRPRDTIGVAVRPGPRSLAVLLAAYRLGVRVAVLDPSAGPDVLLARLAVAAGPIPATPGAGSEAAIALQRNALATLAQSERRGCAIGAAFAFMLDWSAMSGVLTAAATRFGVAPSHLPPVDAGGIDAACDQVCKSVALRRAVMFGAEQVALQHRGLWDLLWARARARA